MLRIYYNAKCSKSRAVLARLQAVGLEPQVIDYLSQPPSRAQLSALLDKIDAPAHALLRDASEKETDVIAILAAAPERLQRPIVETHDAALIARPPERVDAFLGLGDDTP